MPPLTRRAFTAAATAALAAAPSATAQAPNRPNIVYILSDDHRWDFFGAMGHPWLKGATPHMDRMAQSGAHFRNAFVTTSLCSPSRASILSGQMLFRHGVVNNSTDLPDRMPTFPQMLQRAGYRTGFLGKWHMGDQNSNPRPGFDHWVSFRGQGAYFDPLLNVNGKEEKRQGYMADILTEEARRFLQAGKDDPKPFMLYLSHKNVHGPFTPPPRHANRFRNLDIPYPETYPDTEANREGKPDWMLRQRNSWHGAGNALDAPGGFERMYRGYCESLLSVDESIGAVRAELERLGLAENTLLIYHSDNGYLHGEHGLIDKRVMYEESLRVPLLMEWPARLKQPRAVDAMTTTLDILPTLLDVAGLPGPKEMPGRSLLPWIDGQTPGEWRDDFVYCYYWEQEGPMTPTIFGLRTSQYSFITTKGVWDRHELYDIKADPLQKHNLIGKFRNGMNYGRMERYITDPALRTLYQKLDRRLDQQVKELGGTRLASYGAAR